MTFTVKARRLQCPKCGVNPRHHGWQQCRVCLGKTWRKAARKNASARIKKAWRSRKRAKDGLTAFATFADRGPVEAEIEARLGKLPPEQERSS